MSKQSSTWRKMLDFILENRTLNNAIAGNQIIYKIWNIVERYQEKSWSTLQKWWYRLCIDNFLHFIETLILHKNLQKII